ncbi:MAG: cellobiose phosphorylase [Opitutae bacterium]|nr:cellobiose phosphorylase [Opitutae bacterium]
MDTSPATATTHRLRAATDFHLRELTASSGLRAQFLPTGALYALRHRETMLNQLLPGPAEDGLFRLLVRWFDDAASPVGWAPLVGPGLAFGCDGRTASWHGTAAAGTLDCTVTFGLHPVKSGWAWRVCIRNAGTTARKIDLLHAQDLGLADEGAVRNNEAYVSQYLDLLPLSDPRLGHVVLARQNQPMAGGRRPWLAFACAQGAAAYCTDGWQFFGADHRVTGEPVAVRQPALPSKRLQYEFALGGLQSQPLSLAPGATVEVAFVAAYVEDHPAASSLADVALLRDLLPVGWLGADVPTQCHAAGATVFTHAPWLHGARPTVSDWDAWFPGTRRHRELDAAGHVLSFFHGAETHVVSRDKEALVARPHGHILRSGTADWIDDRQFGLTCYAAGIFGAQAYLGNPSLARLLSVVRNHLNVARAHGQRVFLRRGEAWQQLGVPSAFAMEPGVVRWIYRIDDRVIEVRVWCSAAAQASFLELRVASGPPAEFLVTHQLALGANEFEAAGEIEVHDDGWISARPAADGFTAKHLPGTCFALAASSPALLAAHGGDELLHADGIARQGPYAVFQTKAVERCGIILTGATDGAAGLPAAVARLREEYAGTFSPARPPAAPVRLQGSVDVGASRLNEVLPWFTHNAAIHFSAPHGLEQYGGAAWGVRDVCQGSVEWLLAAGEFATVRRILTAVFEQQYAHNPKDAAVAGCWPQWFMFAPFRFIQQTHSHGDVCFWPVKALCDYVEASNDLAFLGTALGYTDPVQFTAAGPAETLWAHCDRVVAHCESRFIAGTALVNYGDGDWDDTLQPADPAMRTRMVSAWTVGLAYHTFRQFAEVSRRAGESTRAARLDQLLVRMRRDFASRAMPDGVVAGFLVNEADGRLRPLLHPTDKVTNIRYRLLPMTRSMLAELFTPEEAQRHAALIESELHFNDGVRLMSEPAVYQGGLEKLFKRADTAANVGREVGLQYVHAHIRYAEAMAKLGDADRLWKALQVINPVGLERVVPGAVARQSNVYFSSSDADFADRVEAAARWHELRAGRIPVRGGWRLYSSGPGLYLHKVRSCLLGVRESFGDVVIDPVLPRSLDGLTADTQLLGRPVRLVYSVKSGTSSPAAIRVNGAPLAGLAREANPYRPGGLRIPGALLAARLTGADNCIEIEL